MHTPRRAKPHPRKGAAMRLAPSRAIKHSSWQAAFTWSYHVARCSRFKCQVRKVDGGWYAWRTDQPVRDRPAAVTE